MSFITLMTSTTYEFDSRGTGPALRAAELCDVKIRQAQGFALIDLVFTCGVLGLIASIALPRLVLAKQAAGSASAIGTMRAINSAQLTYALTCGSGFYAPSLTALGTPPPGSNEPYIGGALGTADTVQKSGYIIRVAATPYGGSPPSCNGLGAGDTAQGFKVGADPNVPTNPRFFGTNATQQIYEHTSSLFAGMPEVGEPATGVPLR